MERDVALFRRTKNMVEPRFRVQCRGEALVARCRRYGAMLSELRFTIVTGPYDVTPRSVRKRGHGTTRPAGMSDRNMRVCGQRPTRRTRGIRGSS